MQTTTELADDDGLADGDGLGDFLSGVYDKDESNNPYRSPLSDMSQRCRGDAGRKLRPAGFWIRVAASVVDSLVMSPLAILVFVAIASRNPFLIVLAGIPGLIYKPFMEAKYGATLGKMAVGIAVQDAKGQRLSLGAAYLRFLPSLVYSAICLAELLWIISLPRYGTQGLSLIRESPWELLRIPANLFVIIDCVYAAFTSRKRAIHDMMAGSFCVYVAQPLDYDRAKDNRAAMEYLDQLQS